VKIDGWFRIDGCARDGQTKTVFIAKNFINKYYQIIIPK